MSIYIIWHSRFTIYRVIVFQICKMTESQKVNNKNDDNNNNYAELQILKKHTKQKMKQKQIENYKKMKKEEENEIGEEEGEGNYYSTDNDMKERNRMDF